MSDLNDLFAQARNTEAYLPPTEKVADPHYLQKLNRLERNWME